VIEVVATGALNTVQDLGRKGLRRLGIGTSGAMDELALRTGNILAGNDEDAAGIEVQTFPFHLHFTVAARIAVTGASSSDTRLGGRRLPPWWTCKADAGDTLEIAQPSVGARTYIAFAGGLDVPVILGSRSTHLRNGFGGHNGRALEKGDRLALGPAASGTIYEMGVTPPESILAPTSPGESLAVRAIPAADYEAFPDGVRQTLWTTEWTITPQSDRTGYRLRGEPALLLSEPLELRSYGVVAGIIQVPPSGMPLIQLSDANTAGGYPRIAGVIEADLWRLAQARLGSRMRFVETDYTGALDALRPVADYLASVRSSVAAVTGMMSRLGDSAHSAGE
jgi:5-oxoprolinase (ATP-hydrolysing) subunit C